MASLQPQAASMLQQLLGPSQPGHSAADLGQPAHLPAQQDLTPGQPAPTSGTPGLATTHPALTPGLPGSSFQVQAPGIQPVML